MLNFQPGSPAKLSDIQSMPEAQRGREVVRRVRVGEVTYAKDVGHNTLKVFFKNDVPCYVLGSVAVRAALAEWV